MKIKLTKTTILFIFIAIASLAIVVSAAILTTTNLVNTSKAGETPIYQSNIRECDGKFTFIPIDSKDAESCEQNKTIVEVNCVQRNSLADRCSVGDLGNCPDPKNQNANTLNYGKRLIDFDWACYNNGKVDGPTPTPPVTCLDGGQIKGTFCGLQPSATWSAQFKRAYCGTGTGQEDCGCGTRNTATSFCQDIASCSVNDPNLFVNPACTNAQKKKWCEVKANKCYNSHTGTCGDSASDGTCDGNGVENAQCGYPDDVACKPGLSCIANKCKVTVASTPVVTTTVAPSSVVATPTISLNPTQPQFISDKLTFDINADNKPEFSYNSSTGVFKYTATLKTSQSADLGLQCAFYQEFPNKNNNYNPRILGTGGKDLTYTTGENDLTFQKNVKTLSVSRELTNIYPKDFVSLSVGEGRNVKGLYFFCQPLKRENNKVVDIKVKSSFCNAAGSTYTSRAYVGYLYTDGGNAKFDYFDQEKADNYRNKKGLYCIPNDGLNTNYNDFP